MTDHRHHIPLPPFGIFLRRLARKACIALGVIAGSLFIGAAGYRWTEGWSWLDSTLNAAYILTGMGPVNTILTPGGKVFAIFYSLFSGVAFLSMVAVLFAPVVHRFLHNMHLEIEADEDNRPPEG